MTYARLSFWQQFFLPFFSKLRITVWIKTINFCSGPAWNQDCQLAPGTDIDIYKVRVQFGCFSECLFKGEGMWNMVSEKPPRVFRTSEKQTLVIRTASRQRSRVTWAKNIMTMTERSVTRAVMWSRHVFSLPCNRLLSRHATPSLGKEVRDDPGKGCYRDNRYVWLLVVITRVSNVSRPSFFLQSLVWFTANFQSFSIRTSFSLWNYFYGGAWNKWYFLSQNILAPLLVVMMELKQWT